MNRKKGPLANSRHRLEQRLAKLPPGLRGHCQRTGELSYILACHFGADPEKARLAGLAHDLARALKPEELLALAKSYGLSPGESDAQNPILLHGPLAAAILEKDCGVDDAELLQAVAWHTTGRANMSLLEKIVFLADKIEPGREGTVPSTTTLRHQAQQDLDAALLSCLEQNLQYLAQEKISSHPATLAARDYLLRQESLTS